MEKQSVRLLWFASILLLPIGCSAGDAVRPALTQSDLEKPDAVAAVLKAGVSKDAKAMAELFFAEGVKAHEQATKGKRSWGPVAKSFGASAIYYPRPLALMGDAEAVLRDIGGANKPEQVRKAVLEGVLNEYRSAIAADDILKELTSEQRTELNQYHQCILQYLGGKTPPSCPPVKWVGLK
jgi:hypothetical protein